MSTVAIVAAGQFPRTEYPRYLIGSADSVICCDGALQTLEKHGIVPDVVIGDMDSVCGRALKRFPGKVVKVEEQDDNDLCKAFDHVMREMQGVDNIHIIGATGRSEAHTLGNLSQLMRFEYEYDLADKGIRLDMVSDYSTAFVVTDTCELHLGEGRRVSLITQDPTLRLTSKGLRWPLDGVSLDQWWKATLNVATSDVVNLSFSHKVPLLVILD